MATDIFSLRRMQVASWIYLAVLTLGSWLLISWTLAWSVLTGGAIAIVSYWATQKDLAGFFGNLEVGPDLDRKGARATFSKSGFLVRFWIRFACIGVVVLLLIRYSAIDTFGLILGLSTVVFGVIFTAVEIIRRYYFSGRR